MMAASTNRAEAGTAADGLEDGASVGIELGDADGDSVGLKVAPVGDMDGDAVGCGKNARRHTSSSLSSQMEFVRRVAEGSPHCA